MIQQHLDSSTSPVLEHATAGPPQSPPPAVAALITATHREIAQGHQERRHRITLLDTLLARMWFALARRTARLAWRMAVAGKRRMT